MDAAVLSLDGSWTDSNRPGDEVVVGNAGRGSTKRDENGVQKERLLVWRGEKTCAFRELRRYGGTRTEYRDLEITMLQVSPLAFLEVPEGVRKCTHALGRKKAGLVAAEIYGATSATERIDTVLNIFH